MLLRWFGGVVVEDSGIGFVEWWGCGFGVGDGFVSRRSCARLVVELETLGVRRIDGVDDWVLKGERGFDSALPEASEEQKEEAELREQKGGPDAGLSEHVHCGSGGEDDGGESEEG